MIDIRDTYGFKFVLVLRVRDAEIGNPLRLRYASKVVVLRKTVELREELVGMIYPLTRYSAFSR